MARVVGVDIPNNKRLDIAFTYIFGVGRTTSNKVCAELNFDPAMKVRDLTEEQLTTLANHLNKKYVVEGALRRQLAAAISRLRDINCYRGLRHRRSLPVRGQRTRTNARSRKGPKKTVAGKKSVKGMKG
ncbi:MAG: 30S ribosomal protein S13 [Planctomycetota bacterium]|nr:30S ribosomal protein S13 [Planctomycetota bacterium]